VTSVESTDRYCLTVVSQCHCHPKLGPGDTGAADKLRQPTGFWFQNMYIPLAALLLPRLNPYVARSTHCRRALVACDFETVLPPPTHRKPRSDSMAARSAATSDPPQTAGLKAFTGLVNTRQSADMKRVVEDFPKFMVRCFLKDVPSSGSGHTQPFQGQLYSQKFPLEKETWDFLRILDCPETRCRCACVHFHHLPDDLMQSSLTINDYQVLASNERSFASNCHW
jgi:hypothetical protein